MRFLSGRPPLSRGRIWRHPPIPRKSCRRSPGSGQEEGRPPKRRRRSNVVRILFKHPSFRNLHSSAMASTCFRPSAFFDFMSGRLFGVPALADSHCEETTPPAMALRNPVSSVCGDLSSSADLRRPPPAAVCQPYAFRSLLACSSGQSDVTRP